jgi:alanyl-tRNA synthetase
MRTSTRAIRKAFLDYFKRQGHKIIESSPLVPLNDPSLLFTNAGMVQFKEVFIGREQRDYKRAASSQKCIRAGGKHNDLENVGYTLRHHTFFEMLGNFSFGDYFKEEAIRFGWEFLVKEIGLPPEDMWVSVYKEDEEAYIIWRDKIGIPEEKIFRFGKKDNFWEMASYGPCGPCSEIGIDLGVSMGCGSPSCKVGCECDRYVELWNLVFMQFERALDGSVKPLPKPSIDTGLGLERLAAVVQGVKGNFEIDIIKPLIDCIVDLAKIEYGKDKAQEVSLRAISDHARAASFLIAEGVFPDKTGREYVLRRIIRRAIRHGHKLGIKEPFFFKICAEVIRIMSDDYPELKQYKQLILDITKEEEKYFRFTLERGIKLIQENQNWEIKDKDKFLPGAIAFKLYDTYGFPLDLVEVIGKEEGFKVDLEGFNLKMEEQRKRSVWKTTFLQTSQDLLMEIAQSCGPTVFIREKRSCRSKVLAIIKDNKRRKKVSAKEQVEIIVNVTPFYPEAGGQVGDKGEIIGPLGRFEVEDTVKTSHGLILHKGKVLKGEIRCDDEVNLKIDLIHQEAIRKNHTATHLLHSNLRQVLGPNVTQKGSLVSADKLRFDYSYIGSLKEDELRKIEKGVNENIQKNLLVTQKYMSLKEAKDKGAIALFQEKYGDMVRVVKIGKLSMELCGGLHVRRTGEIGFFKIINETSIAKGVRRIEALTGHGAEDYIRRQEEELLKASQILGVPEQRLSLKIAQLMEQMKQMEQEIASLKTKIAKGEIYHGLRQELKNIKGIQVISALTEISEPRVLREVGDYLKDRIKSGIIIVGGKEQKKAHLCAMVTKDLIDRFDAAKIIKELAKKIGGQGGGKPEMAQAGSKYPERLDSALKSIHKVIESMF